MKTLDCKDGIHSLDNDIYTTVNDSVWKMLK